VEESGTVGSPGEVVKIRQSARSVAASLEGDPTGQPSVDTPLVVVGGEAIQLSMEVAALRAWRRHRPAQQGRTGQGMPAGITRE